MQSVQHLLSAALHGETPVLVIVAGDVFGPAVVVPLSLAAVALQLSVVVVVRGIPGPLAKPDCLLELAHGRSR